MIAKRNCDTTPLSETGLIRRPILINLKRLIFYLVFFLVFCFSGLLTMLTIMRGGFQYRMGLVSALVIPLFLIYGIKIEGVSIAYMALASVVLLSGLYNHSSLREIVLFMRILGFSYLMYRLVEIYIRPDNIARIIRLCVAIAMIQLPLVVLQQLAYDHIPTRVKAGVSLTDFDFGAFNFKCDASMAFFLISIVIFLLFDKKRNYIVRHKWLVVAWLTLTVLIAHSEAAKVIILLVWGGYFVTHLAPRTIVYFVTVVILVIGPLALSGVLDDISYGLVRALESNTQIEGKEEAFLSGGFGRGAAVAYYIKRGIRWLGDGPSRYYSPITRTKLIGNVGHIFTFYSEVGLLGWLLSVLIFFLIAFPGRGARMRVGWVNLLIFVSVQLLGFTTQIMNDISVVLIYCIMAKVHLVPLQTEVSGVGE